MTGQAGAAPAAGCRGAVIGIGNEFRRDDGIGPAVLARLRGQVPAWVRLVLRAGPPAGCTGSSLALKMPRRAPRSARMASAWTRQSAWHGRLTGCRTG